MNFVFSCPSSHPAPRWVAHGLRARGHTVQFFTPFAMAGDSDIDNFPVPEVVRSELRRRRLPSMLGQDTLRNSAVIYEGLRVLAERGQRSKINIHLQRRVNEAVQKNAIRHMRKHKKPDAIFATGSLSRNISEYAYEQDIPLVLYLPQPVMRFVDTIVPGQSRAMHAGEKIGAAELMATSVFVASSCLVEDSIINEGINRTIIRHPLGFPSLLTSDRMSAALERRSSCQAFHLLYVGRVSPQKNLPTLLAALKQLAVTFNVRLTAVTRDTANMLKLVKEHQLEHKVDIRPSMGRSELFDVMRDHHCFVLPSTFEGYGLVIVEALANGLPVITTPYTAGGDLGINGIAGSIVQASETNQIVAAVQELIENPLLAQRYSKGAEELTRTLSWNDYAQIVSQKLEIALMGSF